MADNQPQYGFRWAVGYGNAPTPPIFEAIIATAASFDVTGGASNVGLGPGDPVYGLSTGGVTLCPGAETTAIAPLGIVMGVAPVWNGSEMENKRLVPSDTAWGTNLTRQTKIFYAPVTAGLWEIDCDDATTATTEAAYQALIHSNINYTLTGGIGSMASDRAYPKADISTTATTNSLVLRIVGISKTARNMDFTGANVKILVKFNLAQEPGYASVAAPTLNSTTGL
jgi:hypothetical protein